MAGGGEVSILGTLVIVVLKAQNLIDNHKFYKQDPYAVVSLASHTQKTPPEPKGGQHPVWDEEMRFPIMASEDTRNRTLKVKVYSKEKKDDLLLGEGEVDISETLRSGEFDDWVPLSIGNTQRGDIYLEMTFFSAGPAPLNRRKSKFTLAQRLSRPAETQQNRPPPPHRGSQGSQSASPPAHSQHLAVPNSRSHSGSPAHKDAALPPLPAQAGSAPPPAVPAILRAGAGAGAVTRPRVQSTAVPTARPMSYAPSERPVSYAGDDHEHELPTPTQYNPNPHPFQQSHQQKPSLPYQSPQASAQPYVSPYPPYHNSTTSAPSSPPLPAAPAEQYVSPYPPYHTPSQGPPSPPHGQTHGRTSSFSSLSSQQQQQYAPHQPAHAGTAPGGYPPQQSHTPQPPASYPPQSHTPQPPGAYPNTPAHGTSAPPPAGFHFPTPTPNYSTPPSNYSSPPPQQAYNAPHGGFYGPPPAGRGYGYNPGQYGQPPRVPSRASSSDLPDPYLEKRYQTPLPLPPGGPSSGSGGHGHSPTPPSAPAPAPVPAAPRVDPGEVAARELQAREEAADRVRREQEQRDAELARRLDQELNIG